MTQYILPATVTEYIIHVTETTCDRLQKNQAQRSPIRIFFLHLHNRRHPDIELSKFYSRSLSRSRYNRPNRSLPSA